MNNNDPPTHRPFEMPRLHDPSRYAGLYVYDFGTHVSVGYTAGEIVVLRASELGRQGTAYEIYRVTDEGAIEMRAIQVGGLALSVAVCFLYPEAETARDDFDSVRLTAEQYPLSRPAELILGRQTLFSPQHIVAIRFLAGAETVLTRWLAVHVPSAGEVVLGGADANSALADGEKRKIDSCDLRVQDGIADRSTQQVLDAIHEPVQR